LFELINRTTALKAGHVDLAACARSLREQHPVIVKGEPKPRIAEGVVILNDPGLAQSCLAMFRVSRTGSEEHKQWT
jgi:hypothetical protein